RSSDLSRVVAAGRRSAGWWCRASASAAVCSVVEVLQEGGDVGPAEVHAGGAGGAAPGIERFDVARSESGAAGLDPALPFGDETASARRIGHVMGPASFLEPRLEERPRPVGEVAAAGAHELAQPHQIVGVEGVRQRRLTGPVLEAMAVGLDAVIAET